MNIFVNRFGINQLKAYVLDLDHSVGLKENPEPSCGFGKEVVEKINNLNDKFANSVKPNYNPWVKRPIIRVDLTNYQDFLSYDGLTIKLSDSRVKSSAEELQFVVVVKVFWKEVPFYVVAAELCRQWKQFGNF